MRDSGTRRQGLRCGPEVCWAPSWNTHFCLFCFQFRRRLTEKECSTKSSSSQSLSMNRVFEQQQQKQKKCRAPFQSGRRKTPVLFASMGVRDFVDNDDEGTLGKHCACGLSLCVGWAVRGRVAGRWSDTMVALDDWSSAYCDSGCLHLLRAFFQLGKTQSSLGSWSGRSCVTVAALSSLSGGVALLSPCCCEPGEPRSSAMLGMGVLSATMRGALRSIRWYS